jgi:hypothetical protein
MNSASGNSASIAYNERVSLPATLTIAVCLAAAWIAAGSSGLLAHSLRHVLTCLLLGVSVIITWPSSSKQGRDWLVLVAGIAISFILAVFPLEVANILSVVIILSMLAHLRGGLDGRAFFLTALAALCFAVCHFLFQSYPSFWTIENQLGQALGWLASKITNQNLSTGATFGGVDFLLLMIFLYGLWLYNSASPRMQHALFAGLAIIASQFVYLIALAYFEKILAALPDPIYPVEDDYMRMGATVWQNSLRSMIPWNLPIIAMILQSLVAATMFRMTSWRADPVFMPQDIPLVGNKPNNTPINNRKSAEPNIFYKIAPAITAMLLAGLTTLWTIKPDLNGKTILAYQTAEVPWTTPKHGESGENGYGLLADYVQILGGKFVLSQKLSSEELAAADVVLLLKPDTKFSKDEKSRLNEFVARGGSLLVSSDRNATADSRKKLEEVLAPAGIQFTADIATCKTEGWEQTLEVLNHPVTLGTNDLRNDFGLETCSTLHVKSPAYPLLIGKWGQNESGHAASDRLGDLILLAESDQSNGGKIIVLGDMGCLSNDMLPDSYEFMGRLLGYLAQKTPAIPLWRTAGVFFFAALLLVFIVTMRKASQATIAAVVFAAAIIFCEYGSLDYQRIAPSEAGKSPRRLALIDASHLEAYSDKLWHHLPTVKEFSGSDWPDRGVGNFARTLERNGFLPLRLRELTPARLERASLLISIAPGRRYSMDEMSAIRKFVESGGTLLCIAGAEESRAINALLDKFDLKVPHSPVLPNETVREPAPNGALAPKYAKTNDNDLDTVELFAAWQIESLAIGSQGEEIYPYVSRFEKNGEKMLIVSRRIGNGCIALIADTYFATNLNPDPALNAEEENERFWQWFLLQIAGSAETRKIKSLPKTPGNATKESVPMQESEPDEG